MIRTAQALVAPGKGILAADESTPTMARRLATVGLESTEERRRAYRQMLFETPGLPEHVSGVILFDETLRQRTHDGTPMVELPHGAGTRPRHQGGRWHATAGGVPRRGGHRRAGRPA